MLRPEGWKIGTDAGMGPGSDGAAGRFQAGLWSRRLESSVERSGATTSQGRWSGDPGAMDGTLAEEGCTSKSPRGR